MNRRENKILRDIILENKLNIKKFMDAYEVKERTIRNDIREINESLKQKKFGTIEVDLNGKVSISEEDKDLKRYVDFFSGFDYYSYCLSKEERTTVLAMLLLNADGYITVEDLTEKIGASRNTLLKDLQELKDWFSENDMELNSQVRLGYIVYASEEQIRKGMKKLLEVNGDDNGYKTGHNLSIFWNLLLKEADKLCVYDTVKNMIKEEEDALQIILSDYSFYEAAMELMIAINRVAQKKLIPETYSWEKMKLKKSSKYLFSNNLFDRIFEILEISVPEREIIYYTECMKRKSYLKDISHHDNGNAININLLIAETIYKIANYFNIDFYLDFSLYDLLVAHMKSAVYRIKNNETLVNPLKETLFKDYPYIFHAVRENLEPLENFIGDSFSEDEMSFIVLYFASVLEKEKAESEKNKKVKVALICETGRGTAQFMMAKLKRLEGMIDVVAVTSVHNMNEMGNSEIEMIITTIPVEMSTIPVVKVRSAMLSKEDLLDIQSQAIDILDGNINHIEEKKEENALDEINIHGALYELLDEDRVLIDYPAKDWEDAIRQSGKLLFKTGAVKAQYIEEMVNNVKKNGAYIVVCPETALPHADPDKGVIYEAASIVKLEKPIDFHSEFNNPVRFVIGMSIKSAESINKAIFDLMIIFGNEDARKLLNKMPDGKALLQAIKKFEKKEGIKGE
ncbi:MAG: PTS sugar transporter subunit IIA [Eubacteriales bacterium]|nr:PTS sugar transporter subunit IIA [Eubacteriales bacterium]